MSMKTRRGVVATLAAGALSLTLAPSAFAGDVVNSDSPAIGVPEATAGEANLYRIADADRILTAIKASKSADWGTIYEDVENVWQCNAPHPVDGTEVKPLWIDPNGPKPPPGSFVTPEVGDVYAFPLAVGPGNSRDPLYVECEVVVGDVDTFGIMDIIVARSDDYAYALASAPLADVRNAPILLNPTAALNGDVADEIERLAAIAKSGDEWGEEGYVRVHILGGTDALSHDVENAIDALDGVDVTFRYQGIDRYETAVNLAWVTAGVYGIESGASIPNLNVYLTTGINFPDALAAGAAAANNDGVVLLTKGTELDRRGFTDNFLIGLNDWVNDDGPWADENWTIDINTSEIFAVGGPSATAAEDFEIRLADAYVGDDRYETAAITATETFDDPEFMAIVSGENFADALVGSGFIANADGPLLLTRNAFLSPVTADYLMANVDDGDTIIVFGGGASVSPQVSADVQDVLDELFALPEW